MNPAERAADRLLALIARTRAENLNTSPDPCLDAITLWGSAVPTVREVLGTLETHDDTLSEVEFVYRTAVEAWLRGTVPDGTRVEEALLERIRMALDPPADLIF